MTPNITPLTLTSAVSLRCLHLTNFLLDFSLGGLDTSPSCAQSGSLVLSSQVCPSVSHLHLSKECHHSPAMGPWFSSSPPRCICFPLHLAYNPRSLLGATRWAAHRATHTCSWSVSGCVQQEKEVKVRTQKLSLQFDIATMSST